jgi:membrane-bound metal-dependent hydrolase YbcI (DUF457 family)
VKGIAHFVTGIAITTFFPHIVHDAALALSFGPLLGGLAGLLPDTLDFKFVRPGSRVDSEIDPARLLTPSGQPDRQAMAEGIAAAMNQALVTGQQTQVRLHTLKLGADLWRQYRLEFDLEQDQVVVRLGPAVTTAQVAYPGSEIPGLEPGRAQVGACILPTYEGGTTVDIFSGPSLAFDRAGDAVQVTFLPWHRAWTHSLALALAALAHVLEDQLGFMGSSLFWPLSQRRVAGLRLFHSGDAQPNLLAVWIGLATILLNLDRFSGAPSIPVLPYVLGVMVAPCLFFLLVGRWTGNRYLCYNEPGGER